MKRSFRFFLVAGVVSLLIGIAVSPFASSNPDGLERVAEEKGFIENAESAELWSSSPLPDYGVDGVESEHISTSLAGLIGTMATLIVGFGVGRMLMKRRDEGKS
ncbi:PDGLE domain-containing protein [bacterium]|nr:PDGLE domain-containing protein [bacterium]